MDINIMYNIIQMNIIENCKNDIDYFISSNSENLKYYYIYGGVSKLELEKRKTQHVHDKQPTESDDKWKILEITRLVIKNKNKLE